MPSYYYKSNTICHNPHTQLQHVDSHDCDLCVCPGVEEGPVAAGSGGAGATAEPGAAEPWVGEAFRLHGSDPRPAAEASSAGRLPAHLPQRSLQETPSQVCACMCVLHITLFYYDILLFMFLLYSLPEWSSERTCWSRAICTVSLTYDRYLAVWIMLLHQSSATLKRLNMCVFVFL